MISTILQAVLLIGALNAVLAALLVLAEKRLVDFGECTITINRDKQIITEGGRTLLSTLNSQKIFLPSACGGRGTCSYCKCGVEGGGPLLPTEEAVLTEEEINGRVRLACQLKVKNDLAIIIPEALFAIKEYRAEVSEIEDLTYDIKRIRLRLIDPAEISFRPGQYVQLHSQPFERVKQRLSRAYSIASSADERTFIDLMIRLVPEGVCTTWVHEHLAIGDEVIFTGPMGDFRYHENTGEVILVAGGSGMAPIIPLLGEIEEKKIARRVTYFFGAGNGSDLFYTDVLQAFERRISRFEYVPTLASPRTEDRWDGESGLITQPLERYLQTIDMKGAQAYLCGSPGMIKACIQILNQYGLDNAHIYFDPFA